MHPHTKKYFNVIEFLRIISASTTRNILTPLILATEMFDYDHNISMLQFRCGISFNLDIFYLGICLRDKLSCTKPVPFVKKS